MKKENQQTVSTLFPPVSDIALMEFMERLYNSLAGEEPFPKTRAAVLRKGAKRPFRRAVPFSQLPSSTRTRLLDLARKSLSESLSADGAARLQEGVAKAENGSRQSRNQSAGLSVKDALPDSSAIINHWYAIAEQGQRFPSEIYEKVGQEALQKGSPLVAYDIFSTALKHDPHNVRMRSMLALTLVETGAVEKAATILKALYDTGKADSDTIGILARTFKDLAWKLNSASHMKKAYRLYLEGYRKAISRRGKQWRDQAIYTGVNAATTALFAGMPSKARTLAAEAHHLCKLDIRRGGSDYWTIATLAETAAILGRWKDAEAFYTQAGAIGQGKYRLLTSTRRQLRHILGYLGENPSRFDHCLKLPQVVVFSGHMIDSPGRAHPRFPASLERGIREEIALKLEALNANVSYSSAACGSDIIFLEEMAKRRSKAANPDDVEINIVIPCALQSFRTLSVDVVSGSWGNRLRRVLRHATHLLEANPQQHAANALDFEYTNLLLVGLTQLRAAILDTQIAPLAVWDGNEGDGEGGTASMVKLWRDRGISPNIIDIAKLLRQAPPETRSGNRNEIAISARSENEDAGSRKLPGASTRRVCAMLFGDVVGYSKLSEEQIEPFIHNFLGMVARIASGYSSSILFRNTWGDAIHMLFSSVEAAGLFALDLCDLCAKADWKASNLPKDLNLRIGLHAGPVERYTDPVLQTEVYTGTHVSRAARIEQITPPGYVYGSQEFAAIVSSLNVSSLAVNYAGHIYLPKQYGGYPLYHVRRV
ncbi:MAG: tetratricopeptide repeat protein [Nitrospinae bacterium]|nr:tetratricopeptide repeat protein [Nitrospinota bacterium]